MNLKHSLLFTILLALLSVSAWAQQPAYTNYIYDGYHVGEGVWVGGSEDNTAPNLIDNNLETHYQVSYSQEQCTSWQSDTWVDFHSEKV